MDGEDDQINWFVICWFCICWHCRAKDSLWCDETLGTNVVKRCSVDQLWYIWLLSYWISYDRGVALLVARRNEAGSRETPPCEQEHRTGSAFGATTLWTSGLIPTTDLELIFQGLWVESKLVHISWERWNTGMEGVSKSKDAVRSHELHIGSPSFIAANKSWP